jgi:hypothetical protein
MAAGSTSTATSTQPDAASALEHQLDGLAGKIDALARAQLGPLAVLDLAVDEHVTVGDPLLGFATRAAQAGGLQELVELDEFPSTGKRMVMA